MKKETLIWTIIIASFFLIGIWIGYDAGFDNSQENIYDYNQGYFDGITVRLFDSDDVVLPSGDNYAIGIQTDVWGSYESIYINTPTGRIDNSTDIYIYRTNVPTEVVRMILEDR